MSTQKFPFSKNFGPYIMDSYYESLFYTLQTLTDEKEATSKCFYAHSIITEAARPTEIVIISKKLTETARRESNT